MGEENVISHVGRRRGVTSKTSELVVFTRMKELNAYVLETVAKGPKSYRYSYLNHMMNYSLDALESMFLANSVLVASGDEKAFCHRHELQRQAYVKLKLLFHLSFLASEKKIITEKQCSQIALLGERTTAALVGWISADSKRFQ